MSDSGEFEQSKSEDSQGAEPTHSHADPDHRSHDLTDAGAVVRSIIQTNHIDPHASGHHEHADPDGDLDPTEGATIGLP